MATALKATGQRRAASSPFARFGAGMKGGANVHGESSLETFANVGGLGATHEDADGFYQFLNRYAPANYRFHDAAVQFWQYAEPFDDWQDTYGADAVCVFYHSGHGAMDADGVFFVPLGGEWGGKTWVNSTEMQLGNERQRYVFWSTCLSLRVLDGQSPARTWQGANRGLRMIFGWETVSWDSPIYGAKFWEHWSAGDSFSRAWMNSGWDAGHDQAPSAAGIGATQAEAQDRVFNERVFQWARPTSADWWWWTWYGATKTIAADPVTLEAAPADAYLVQLGALPSLRKSMSDIGPTAVLNDGRARVTLGESSGDETTKELGVQRLETAARSVVQALALDGVELVPHLVRPVMSAGAQQGSDTTTTPKISGYAVEYRQAIDGVRIITPESGYVRVHLDAAGAPISADITARPVRGLRTQAVRSAPAPDGAVTAAFDDVGAALDVRAGAVFGAGVAAAPIEGTREIGYVTDGATGFLGVQQGYLADFGDGVSKRVRVTLPLNG